MYTVTKENAHNNGTLNSGDEIFLKILRQRLLTSIFVDRRLHMELFMWHCSVYSLLVFLTPGRRPRIGTWKSEMT